MIASAIVFYAISLIILVSAIMMAFSKNLVHSAIYMAATFLGVAGIYLMLAADFLAVAQILIYVGAISIILIFGVMLTKRTNINETNLFNRYKFAAGVVSIALFLIIAHFSFWTDWKVNLPAEVQGTTAQIADLLLNNYVVPFEISGLLLLVALVGAIVIGKGDSNLK